MFYFSAQSENRLKTCSLPLQRLFRMVIKHMDCTILEGRRSEKRQQKLFVQGKTQLLKGKHNQRFLSNAVDVAPYPLDWKDRSRFYYFAGFVLGMAKLLHIPIRWGGDWNQNHHFNDQHFDDLVHFELDQLKGNHK